MKIPGRLFCKSIIVDLSTMNQFLTVPDFVDEDAAKHHKRKTISNVFRMWMQDTKEDIESIV